MTSLGETPVTVTDTGSLEEYHHTLDTRVRFAETDAQGVVFFGEYVTYMDEAVLQYLREIDYDYEHLVGGEWELVVDHVDLDYHASAGFGDVLANYVRVEDVGERSITFAYRCLDADDGTLVASGSTVMVAVDETGETRAIPDAFRAAVAEYRATAS